MNTQFFDTWTTQLKKGLLSFIVLSVLKQKECYGYELIAEVQKQLNIDVAEGTLYPLLNRLKEDGLVTSKWVEQETGMPRKYYTLNEQGLVTLKGMNEYWLNMNFSMQKLILTNG